MKRIAVIAAFVSAGACASLLGLRSTDQHRNFEHRSHVVAGIACTKCHADTVVASSTAAVRLPVESLCWSCHPMPHDSRPCLVCHGAEGTTTRVEMARKYSTFSHLAHVPKVSGQCVRCHLGVQEDDNRLLPTMATCLSCHAHEDQFEPGACDRCHVNLEDESVRPSSHVVHGVDFTERHGAAASANSDLCSTCHSTTDCASCHGVSTPALPWRLALAPARLEGLHRAGFMARHSTEARAAPGTCTTCHSPTTCQSCHLSSGIAAGAPTGSPHPPGWVGFASNRHGIEARRDPAACASCHSGAGEMLCVSCHKVGGVGGTVHPVGWTSSKNERADLPCRLCHQPG